MQLLQDLGRTPVVVSGQLRPGVYAIPGDVSSQFFTGLFFALSLLDGESTVKIIGHLESEPYVRMTQQVLKAFGVSVKKEGETYRIAGNQQYRPRDFTIEGDHSQAAFFEVLGAAAGPITIKGLAQHSCQGDRAMLRLIRTCGANVRWEADDVTISKAALRPFSVNVSDTPDLAPAICVLACLCRGKSTIDGTRRLRLKESDRVQAIVDMLRALGGEVSASDNQIEIVGTGRLHGGVVDSKNDHRIAMATAACAAFCDSPVQLTDASCVKKSYPDFYRDYQSLGGNMHGFYLE